MARDVKVIITSDLSGEDGADEVRFGWDGSNYEIDLTKKERDSLEKALKPYLDKARPGSTGKLRDRKSGSSKPSRRDPEELNKIREWARNNGFTVADRGRISAEIQDAYNAAQK